MLDKITKIKLIFILFLCLANIFVWYAIFCEDRRGILTVSFLNVGQGDAIFIDTPNGNQILLDGGPDKKVLRELGGIMPFYDRSIDLVALSHPHSDHIAGLIDVLPRYNPLGFLSSGTKANTPEYKSLQSYLEAKLPSNIENIVARRGMKIDTGDGVLLEVLLPATDVSNSTPHDGMMVLSLQYGNTKYIFTGDMEKSLENYLISMDKSRLKSNVLKIGHHGSKNSTSDAFLGYINPEYSAISVGRGNKYGHPTDDIINKLMLFGSTILRTDNKGTFSIKSDGEKIIEVFE